MNIFKPIIDKFKNIFTPKKDVTPEELQTNQQLGQDPGLNQVMSVPLNQWIAPIPQSFDFRVDNSYVVLSYLKSLGYNSAIWSLNEYHPEPDVCDHIHGNNFTLDELLLNAQHNPPSPIFTLSHPGCYCFLTCNPPASPQNIPDTAPGLPSYGNQQDLVFYKEQLFSRLVPIQLDSVTMLPPEDDVLRYSNMDKYNLARYGTDKQTVVSYIKPVYLNKEIICYLPLNLRRPIIEKLKGCQFKIINNFSFVYFPDLNRNLLIPSKLLESINMEINKEIDTKSLNRGDFFFNQNLELCILQNKHDDIITYFIPSLNHLQQDKHQTVLLISNS